MKELLQVICFIGILGRIGGYEVGSNTLPMMLALIAGFVLALLAVTAIANALDRRKR